MKVVSAWSRRMLPRRHATAGIPPPRMRGLNDHQEAQGSPGSSNPFGEQQAQPLAQLASSGEAGLGGPAAAAARGQALPPMIQLDSVPSTSGVSRACRECLALQWGCVRGAPACNIVSCWLEQPLLGQPLPAQGCPRLPCSTAPQCCPATPPPIPACVNPPITQRGGPGYGPPPVTSTVYYGGDAGTPGGGGAGGAGAGFLRRNRRVTLSTKDCTSIAEGLKKIYFTKVGPAFCSRLGYLLLGRAVL